MENIVPTSHYSYVEKITTSQKILILPLTLVDMLKQLLNRPSTLNALIRKKNITLQCQQHQLESLCQVMLLLYQKVPA